MEFKSKSLEYYQQIADEDTQIDKSNLSEKLYTIPNLHSKWLRFCYGEIDRLLKMEANLRTKYREKFEFYMTKYNLDVKPAYAKVFIESDKDYNQILYATNVQRRKVEFLEQMVKKMNALSYDIQNIVKWEMFKMGVN